MSTEDKRYEVPLPKDWPGHVKSAVLHVVSLAHLVIAYARGRAARSGSRARLQAQLNGARNEIALLEEELRIKDARMARLDPRRRPHYRSTERLAILALRAARGWSGAKTARRFHIQPATIGAWMQRINEGGESALLQTPEPVNRFPDFVRDIVRRLKTLCPTMGKRRIAHTLARAGLHLGATTVRRMLNEEPPQRRDEGGREEVDPESCGPVKARYVNHSWQVDLTVVPTTAGLWAPWSPFALAQVWPFCWWVACIVDHLSRRALGFAVFTRQPSSLDVRRFLGRTISRVGVAPRYLLSDKGGQFWSDEHKQWCRGKGIRPRYASTGKVGATAIVERFIRSLKNEWLRRIAVSLSRDRFRRQLSLYREWYNELRPHESLFGRTPGEVYFGRPAAAEKPRYEPRPFWPSGSPCAEPYAEPRARPGHRLELAVDYLEGSRCLPIVRLKRAA